MATAKKTTIKKTRPAPKVTKIKKSNFELSRFQKVIKEGYFKHTSIYPALGVLLAILVLLIGLFIFKRGLFVAGTVNGRIVTSPEFYQSLTKSGGDNAFDSIVRDTLIKQEASKKGIQVSSKDVDARIATIEKNLGGKENLAKAITQNKTTMEELRKQIGLQLMAEKILEKDIAVSDADVTKFTQENKDQVASMTKDQIKEQVKSQKFNDKFTSWLDNLKKNSKISKYY